MAAPDAARPDVFVVGGSKCGTTSLYRMLQLAEGAGTSSTRKELHYFSAPEILERLAAPGDQGVARLVIRDEAAYLAEFAHLPAGTASVVDVSPSYLQNPNVPARIAGFAPAARIVILLRDPVAKVFSQYVHLWSSGSETLAFAEAFAASAERRAAGYSPMWDYEAGGYYADAVARYLDRFGRDRVRVEIFEELFGADPAAARGLEAFLGVAFAKGPPPRINPSGRVKSRLWGAFLGNDAPLAGVKRLIPLGLRGRLGGRVRAALKTEKPQLDPGMRARLRALYASDVARLEALLGRSTGWGSPCRARATNGVSARTPGRPRVNRGVK